MKAEIEAHAAFVPFTKNKMPSKRPFRVLGQLDIESLEIGLPKKQLHKQFKTVPPAVPKMFAHLQGIAEALKNLEESKAEMDKLEGGLASLTQHEVLEV